MEQDIVAEGVIKILKNYVTKNIELNADTHIDGLGIDSLTFIEILFELEKHFDIRIPDRVDTIGGEFRTIGTLIETVRTSPKFP